MSETLIPIRVNLYLWLLTGRSNDFYNQALNTGVSYSVADTPEEVTAVRKLLKLDQPETDFHVLAVLAASKMSTSFIRTMPYERDIVFVNGLLSLPPVSASHEMLPPDSHSWPSVDGGFAGRYGAARITFTDVGNGRAMIAAGDYSGFTDYTLAEEDGGTFRLSFARAPELGIRAHFRVASWNTGDVVAVNLSPTRYPFRSVADSINRNGTARRLMNAEGTAQAFAESSNPARQVGMSGLAVMRRMLRFVNEDQSGFAVSTAFDDDGVEPLQKLYEIDPMFRAALTDQEVDNKEPAGFDA